MLDILLWSLFVGAVSYQTRDKDLREWFIEQLGHMSRTLGARDYDVSKATLGKRLQALLWTDAMSRGEDKVWSDVDRSWQQHRQPHQQY